MCCALLLQSTNHRQVTVKTWAFVYLSVKVVDKGGIRSEVSVGLTCMRFTLSFSGGRLLTTWGDRVFVLGVLERVVVSCIRYRHTVLGRGYWSNHRTKTTCTIGS